VTPSDELAGPRILRAFAEAHPRAVFIEIGANDGVQYSQLRPFIVSLPWSGVMVEPVPWLFSRLRDNYRENERLGFENAAISEADGTVPFYYVPPAGDQESEADPIWTDAVGSLSRAEVEATLDAARKFAAQSPNIQLPDVSSRIERIDVASLTFESLCRKHGIERLDLLLIDAEGYDWEIIKRIDFERHRPRLLIFESLHFSAEERDQSTAHLEGLGYELLYEGFDTWCHDPRVDDQLARCWRTVRPATPTRVGRLLHQVRARLAPVFAGGSHRR
jgi:FkbM family methyltransferase